MLIRNGHIREKVNGIKLLDIWSTLPFAVYVLWLLAFPMDGFLSAGSGGGGHSLEWFLIPHALALLLAGRFVTGERLPALLSFAGTGLTMVLTASFTVISMNVQALMAIIGISAAPLALKACSTLKRSGNPPVAAAAGLAAGNALLCLMIHLPFINEFKLLAISIALLVPMLVPSVLPVTLAVKGLFRYIPFIFVFQLLSGMMYGYLMKEYAAHSFLAGSELIFYIAAVLLGVGMAGSKREGLLAAGVLCGMFSLSFLHGKTAFMINMSMYSMQGAVGFVDLFLICLLLSYENVNRALGYGLGTTCLGILCGKFISFYAGKYLPVYMSAGNIILTSSVLLLYLRCKNKGLLQESPERPYSGDSGAELPESGAIAVRGCIEPLVTLPPGFNKKFSDKEKRVLAQVLQGKTFKETAEALEISVSSVKTYMRRIYEKTGVARKDDLVEMLAGHGAPAKRTDEKVIPLRSVN